MTSVSSKNSAKGVAVIIVHGITTNAVGYSNGLQRKILRRLPKRLRKLVDFRETFWANCIRPQQASYQNRARDIANLKVDWSKRIAILGLGDAAAYQKGGMSTRETAYVQIQEEVNKAVRSLDDPDQPDRPLVFIGHSLGCHIISSYIWDTSRLKSVSLADASLPRFDEIRYVWDELQEHQGRSKKFRRLETLAGIVTMGNNMPLFAFNLAADKIFPLTRQPEDGGPAAFPGPHLGEPHLSKARWINLYDPMDPLGYPLSPLNHHYDDETRIHDRKVRNWLALPYIGSHTGYWDNSTVAREAASLLRDLLEAS